MNIVITFTRSSYVGASNDWLGINIVIGHHTHVIQPVEYNNGLIFYSLGNFLFDAMV